jgi:hypothetical protein
MRLRMPPKSAKPRSCAPLAQMPTAQDLVRERVLEQARHVTARVADRELARLCPIAERVGKTTYRTGARLARELPAVPEPPDNRLLSDYIEPRSFRKRPVAKGKGGGLEPALGRLAKTMRQQKTISIKLPQCGL